jgi:hypothetical protein
MVWVSILEWTLTNREIRSRDRADVISIKR